MKPNKTISETIRQAIRESGLSVRALANATGIERASIGRFMAVERSLRLDKVDVLAEYLGLELRPVIKK